MTRRAPIRLVRLLAVACACLVPAAAAHAAPPVNDLPTSPQDVGALGWTSLSVSQDILVPAVGLGRGLDRARGRRSAALVHGRDRLQEHVVRGHGARGGRAARVGHLDRHREVPAGRDHARPGSAGRSSPAASLAVGKAGATATATAYVTPDAVDGTRGGLSRARRAGHAAVALGRAADADRALRRARRDAAPHPRGLPGDSVQPNTAVRPTTRSTRATPASGIDPTTAHWEFYDKSEHDPVRRATGSCNPSYTWKKPGAHKVIFSVKDRAGNVSMYRFTTLVLDTVRPAVTFSFRPPMPGAHRLRVVVKASESVHIRLLVTQGGRRKPLLRRVVTFWGDAQALPLDSAQRRRRPRRPPHQWHRARSRRQRHGAAAVRRRPRQRAGQLHHTVTLPSRFVTDS